MQELFKKIRLYGVSQSLGFLQWELRNWFNRYVKSSYSQHGEDLIIGEYLKTIPTGFYVDVGANDPIRFNNTFRLYKRGWAGINIEPDVNKYAELKKSRPKDITLNLGIGPQEESLIFYKMFPDTLSTFSKEAMLEAKKEGFSLEDTLQVPVKPLAVLLKEQKVSKIHFMSVDTEGFDLQVLQSNDWSKFRPYLICIELGIQNLSENAIHEYLVSKDYELLWNNHVNGIYRDTLGS